MTAIPMRGLTVRQPWAWAIIHGGKDVENRSRSLGQYRGPVAVHAAVRDAPMLYDARAQETDSARLVWWSLNGYPTQRGAVIGVVDLVDVHHGPVAGGLHGCFHDCDVLGWSPVVEGDKTACCSPWAQADHEHLMLANPRPLSEPIPWRGRLGLWTVPPDLDAAIREQVAL